MKTKEEILDCYLANYPWMFTGRENALKAMEEYAQQQVKNLNIPAVISSVCDIHKGTRCERSFPSYTDGKCRECGGQAN